MTILLIMLILIAKPNGPTSLPIKSFAEIAQTNPYLTGINNPCNQSSQSNNS